MKTIREKLEMRYKNQIKQIIFTTNILVKELTWSASGTRIVIVD